MSDILEGRAIERRILLSYAPAEARCAIAALLTLDDRLGEITGATRDPLIGQMRLTWWHDALLALDRAPPPAEPILRDLAAIILPRGIAGARLAALVDGWEAELALDSEPEAAMPGIAEDRGATLFRLAATMLGDEDPRLGRAGAGWALADLARRRDAPEAAREAARQLENLTTAAWPHRLRMLSGMALMAAADINGRRRAGGLSRAMRLLRHRITGR